MSKNNQTYLSCKRALLIGINQYQYQGPIIKELSGCINDVELIANILQENFGFPENHITLLRNEQATRDKILAAMDELVQSVRLNDIVVIHYSGHGSQMTDREGDEPDGLDETIVPYDSGRAPDPNRDITDDEIYIRLLRLTEKTPCVALIFDCCHSGGISRDSFGATARWVEADQRSPEELPPSPLNIEELKQLEQLKQLKEGRRDIGPSGWLPLSQKYVLIAACQDNESAYEYGANGALTYFLSQELVKAGIDTTYRDIFQEVSTQVTAVRRFQHPQIEGTRDRLLFDMRDIEPMRFLSIKERRENTVTLAGGAAHGITKKSQWSIYSPKTKQVTEETPKLGLVEIANVRAVTSDAQILEEIQAHAITVNSRAVEFAHFYGEMRLIVHIQAPAGYEIAVNELTQAIDESDLLRQVEKVKRLI